MKSRLALFAWVAAVGCYGGHTQDSQAGDGTTADGSSMVAPDGTLIGPDGQPIRSDGDDPNAVNADGSRSVDGMTSRDPGAYIDPATGIAGSGALSDVCFLPPDSGPCEAAIRRFYFEPTTGTCEPFVYGGCEGNENNFESPDVCAQKCGAWQGDVTNGCPSPERYCAALCAGVMIENPGDCPDHDCGCGDPMPVPPPPDGGDGWLCSLPPDSGPCDGAFERYYFDPQVGTCLSFSYGGCGGNANNFDDLMFCLGTCSGANAGEPASPCDAGKLLEEVGMCDGVVAEDRCFGDPFSACACIGCEAESCAVTVSFPRTAICL